MNLVKKAASDTEPQAIEVNSGRHIATIYCDGMIQFVLTPDLSVPEMKQLTAIMENFYLFYRNLPD